jgi:hypothetical protein
VASVAFRRAFAEINTAVAQSRRTDQQSTAEITRAESSGWWTMSPPTGPLYRVGHPNTLTGHYEALDAIAAMLREIVVLVPTPPPGASVDAAYLAGGTLALLRSWIRGDLEGTADDIVDTIMTLVPSWLVT